MVDTEALRNDLQSACANLTADIKSLAAAWTASIVARLDRRRGQSGGFPKAFNDPVWGVIELLPWETLLLDSPLLQRLRGVRQLGMAHTVYPGASHDRLEHTRGVVEAAERMIRALTRNAEHRRRFGSDKDEHVPTPSDMDVTAIRLAALLHDIGHGPFSHASEDLIRLRYVTEFDAAENIFRNYFEGVTKVATAETIAVCIILSEPLKRIFEHPKYGAPTSPYTPSDLPAAIAARILGSRSCLTAGYLSGILSGPVDADKLDYMARDCHHAGLPLGLDINRLISKLEVVSVSPQNAPNPELSARAEKSANHRFYDMGISLSGLGAYEQLVIGRVILYDRIYYHHKVRAAEAMVRALIEVAEEERGNSFSLADLYMSLPDDSMVAVISGELKSDKLEGGKGRSSALGTAIHWRDVYYRAFAFASRFIGGLDAFPEPEQRDTRAMRWSDFIDDYNEQGVPADLALAIYYKVVEIAKAVPDLAGDVVDFRPEHVIVDLPLNKVAVSGGDILTRTESGQIGTPNLFFDPQRWSGAYEQQKQCGFVFTPRPYVNVVALAARLVFYDRYELVMNAGADRASKTSDIVHDNWFQGLADAGICLPETAKALIGERSKLAVLRSSSLVVPAAWRTLDPDFCTRMEDEFRAACPNGRPATVIRQIIEALQHICAFIDASEASGTFVNLLDLPEREFQKHFRRHLDSREATVLEGAEYGGGETDLILDRSLVIENKVSGVTDAPFEEKPAAPWQARRYSISLTQDFFVVVQAYKPASETGVMPKPSRIRIAAVDENTAYMHVVVPWGHSVPSRAKVPDNS